MGRRTVFATCLVTLAVLGACSTTDGPSSTELPAGPPAPGMTRIEVSRSGSPFGMAVGSFVIDTSGTTDRNAVFLPAPGTPLSMFASDKEFGAAVYVRVNKSEFVLISGSNVARANAVGPWPLDTTVSPVPPPKDFIYAETPSGPATPCFSYGEAVLCPIVSPPGQVDRILVKGLGIENMTANSRFVGGISAGGTIVIDREPGSVRLVVLQTDGIAYEIANFDAKANAVYRVDFSLASRESSVKEVQPAQQ